MAGLGGREARRARLVALMDIRYNGWAELENPVGF